MSDNSDSEYESEDDEDYIPEEPSSEEDIALGVVEGTDKKKRKKADKQESRKRKGGIQLDEDDEVSDHEESEDEADAKFDAADGADAKTQEKEDSTSKQRVNDLWAAFKQDTAAVRPAVSSSVNQNTEKKVEDKKTEGKASTTAVVQKEEIPKKVEITEIFDFAGEEVKVVKSVDASSIKPASSSDEDKTAVKPKTALPIKRPGGGLGSILGKIGKKPKLSTLEKSKLDWNSFKKDEGIEDELKTSNRDGYLEKQAFLNRVDHKQFKIERDIRQGFRKK